MAKPFPQVISLKSRKCPQCGSNEFGHPDVKPTEKAVEAACKTKDCDFKFELAWLGDHDSLTN
ncbi:MAG: hypothetical protein HY553_12370 [Elusimicrobia bacterium]|nr:hypothetical protein [Elusimicrobiota bacterium]